MKTIIEHIGEVVSKAFEECGYDASYAKITISNRPDLCEYQCNGAMAAAKAYKKAPFMIADEVVEKLSGSSMFEKIESVKPGFININISAGYLADFVNSMSEKEKFGYEPEVTNKTVIVDYGGANAAKPLHVGHLRSAVIGESVKRIQKYAGNNVIGDVHLGDWGLQMGLIIEELRDRKPELPYFDENYTGEYPAEPPFTISELEEIYPTASAKSKDDEAFLARAHEATLKLQSGDKACTAIWHHIMNVSKADLKKNYDNLNVHFDLWKGESDAQPYIPDMVEKMKKDGYAYVSDGALVVDVKEDTDTKEIPPCMILKSDGASLYNTTDLATIMERMRLYHPDEIIYLTDKRQDLYFDQVFRCARKTKLVEPETELKWIGFGTVNGKDGKPFNFFHFMIDLEGGPCVAKRLSGCGSGTEYLAVTPWGDLYPCHQFVGNEKFLMGNVDEGIVREDIRDEFKCCNVYAKEKCRKCFAKFYCSGGCAANSYNFHGNINDAYDVGCELQRKRIECAIMLKVSQMEEEQA